MTNILSVKQLTGSEKPGPLLSAPVLIERLNKRLQHHRQNGASCIVIGPQDGFVLYGSDGSPKPLPEPLIVALRQLANANYVFVKVTTPAGREGLRVYFASPPENHRVELSELIAWPPASAEPTITEDFESPIAEAPAKPRFWPLTLICAAFLCVMSFLMQDSSYGPKVAGFAVTALVWTGVVAIVQYTASAERWLKHMAGGAFLGIVATLMGWNVGATITAFLMDLFK